jgi:uncharacterized protein with PIN domain
MNFLADESCAGPVVRALREAGHDVVAIAEVAKGTVDELVMRHALGERRILITEDPLPVVLRLEKAPEPDTLSPRERAVESTTLPRERRCGKIVP